MELIFIFAIVFPEVFFINFLKIVKIIRAFRIHAFMDDEVFSVFFGNKSVAAMRATQFYGRKTTVLWRKSCSTDLAENLAFGTIVFVKERLWCITAWAGAGLRDITFRTATDRTDLLAVAFFVVRDEIFIGPVLSEIGNERKFINLEFLILWRVGIIESPLLERDISANKLD